MERPRTATLGVLATRYARVIRHSGVGVSAAGGPGHPQSDHSQGRRERPGIDIIERVAASGSTPDPAPSLPAIGGPRSAPAPARDTDRSKSAPGHRPPAHRSGRARTAAALRPGSAADLSSRARSAALTADRTERHLGDPRCGQRSLVPDWRLDRMIGLGHARQAGMGNWVPAFVTECRKYRTQSPAG